MRLALAVAMVVGTGVVAAPGPLDHSATFAQAARTQWDGIFTEAQANRGASLFEAHCIVCHGGGLAPDLVGEGFNSGWDGSSIGELFSLVQTAMPQQEPGSLTPQQYTDIVAHVLNSGGFPVGLHALQPDVNTLNQITFVATRPAAPPSGAQNITSNSAAAQERLLFMSVTSAAGDPVLDLQVDEVQIQLAGTACRIVDLQPETDGMKVALIVDTSDAASGSLVALREGLTGFLDALPARHEVGLFTIAGQVRQREAFTADREVLAETTGGLVAERSGAAVVDGLLDIWDRRFEEEDAWPVFVLVVHDGAGGRFQERDFNEFVADLIRRGATVHAVVVSAQDRGMNTSVSLNLTENTGGIYQAVAAPTALATILPDLAASMAAHYEEAKNRYRVVFTCDAGDSTGSITAGVTRPAVNVRLFADRRRTR